MANPHIIVHLTPQRHRKLKKAAKRSGLSLSQYVSAIIPWEALPEKIDAQTETGEKAESPAPNNRPTLELGRGEGDQGAIQDRRTING